MHTVVGKDSNGSDSRPTYHAHQLIHMPCATKVYPLVITISILSCFVEINSTPVSLEGEQWGDYVAYVKGVYNDLTPTRTSPTQWPPPATKEFFRLAMIKEEPVKRGQIEDIFVQMTITGKVDDILQNKVEIKLENIFKETAGERMVILIEGAPGSGKSTLSVHITQKCSKKEIFPEYELVVLVRLRDPNVQNAKTIAEVLPGRDDNMKIRAAETIVCKDGLGVLFVFDGWDEIPVGLRSNSIFYDLIKSEGRKLHKSAVIVTSRPIASGDLHQLVSTRIEVLGFTPEELKKYFTDCLQGKTTPVETLLERIRENPVVAGSCYLPLNASILVHLFKCNGTLPTTQYGIFSELILTCIYRHYTERTDYKDLSLDSFDQLPEVAKKPFLYLCEIAYDGIMNDKITFSNLPRDITTLSLLQGVQSLAVRGKKMYYNFIHLSVQEVLTAHHISTKLPPSEQLSKFNDLFSTSRFSAVFQFYAAITKLKTPGISDLISRVARKCAVNEPKVEDKILLVALLNCLFEAQDPPLCTTVAGHLGTMLNLCNVRLSIADTLSLGYYLFHTKHSGLNLYNCSIGEDEAKVLFKPGKTYDLISLR